MQKKDFSIKSALKWGYASLRDKLNFFIRVMFFLALCTLLIIILKGYFWEAKNFGMANDPLILTVILLVSFLQILLINGVKKIVFNIYDEEDVKTENLLLDLETYGKLIIVLLIFFAISMVYLISTGVGSALIGGMIYSFFAIPKVAVITGGVLGFIFLAVWIYFYIRCYFVTYFIVDMNSDIMEGLKYSLMITKGVVKKLILIHLIWQGINLFLFSLGYILKFKAIAVIFNVLGVLLLIPFLIGTFVYTYCELLEKTPEEDSFLETIDLEAIFAEIKDRS